ncbi:MAG: glycerol-3-phosphate 1-O-acyltransferase PlsY [Bacillota bacterium]
MSLLIVIILSYFVGAIPVGYLVGRARGVDLTAMGSGSTGATNVFRAVGPGLAILVLALDMAKGVGAAALGCYYSGISPDWGSVVSGMAALVGHVYSVFLRFRGGKGAATGAGVLLFLTPRVMALAAGSYALVLATTRYSSLGTLVGTAMAVISVFLLQHPIAHRVAVVAATAFIVYKHRQNISRLISGQELRLGRKRR